MTSRFSLICAIQVIRRFTSASSAVKKISKGVFIEKRDQDRFPRQRPGALAGRMGEVGAREEIPGHDGVPHENKNDRRQDPRCPAVQGGRQGALREGDRGGHAAQRDRHRRAQHEGRADRSFPTACTWAPLPNARMRGTPCCRGTT